MTTCQDGISALTGRGFSGASLGRASGKVPELDLHSRDCQLAELNIACEESCPTLDACLQHLFWITLNLLCSK